MFKPALKRPCEPPLSQVTRWHHTWTAIGWFALIALVVALFFRESLFFGHSLIPTDVLHKFILPSVKGPPETVQNHYAIDEVTQLYPAAVFWQQSVRNLQIPAWNPYIFGGHPQLATSMWGIYCPIKLLHLVFSAERAYTLGLVLECFLSACFMFAFLREIGRSHSAAFLGACAYSFNSAFLLFYWLYFNVFVWVPLFLFFFERARRAKSPSYSIAASVALALALVGGSIQMTFFVGVLTGFYCLSAVIWRDRTERANLLRRLALIFVVAALLAAAVQT